MKMNRRIFFIIIVLVAVAATSFLFLPMTWRNTPTRLSPITKREVETRNLLREYRLINRLRGDGPMPINIAAFKERVDLRHLERLKPMAWDKLLEEVKRRKEAYALHAIAECEELEAANALEQYYLETPEGDRIFSSTSGYFLLINFAVKAIRLNHEFGKGYKSYSKIKSVLKTNAGILQILEEAGNEEAFETIVEMAMNGVLSEDEVRVTLSHFPFYRHEVFAWVLKKYILSCENKTLVKVACMAINRYVKNICDATGDDMPKDALDGLGDDNKERQEQAVKALCSWSKMGGCSGKGQQH